jgi:hypothetical protein
LFRGWRAGEGDRDSGSYDDESLRDDETMREDEATRRFLLLDGREGGVSSNARLTPFPEALLLLSPLAPLGLGPGFFLACRPALASAAHVLTL